MSLGCPLFPLGWNPPKQPYFPPCLLSPTLTSFWSHLHGGLGRRQAPPTPHGGQRTELLGGHGLSFLLCTPSFERSAENWIWIPKLWIQPKKSEFSEEPLSQTGTKGTECHWVKAMALRTLMRSPTRRKEICLIFHVAFTEVITPAELLIITESRSFASVLEIRFGLCIRTDKYLKNKSTPSSQTCALSAHMGQEKREKI